MHHIFEFNVFFYLSAVMHAYFLKILKFYGEKNNEKRIYIANLITDLNAVHQNPLERTMRLHLERKKILHSNVKMKHANEFSIEFLEANVHYSRIFNSFKLFIIKLLLTFDKQIFGLRFG